MTLYAGQLKEGLRQYARAFFAEVLHVFQAPFIGLPIVIWGYFVISYIALPNNIWNSNLLDPDDYTYLSSTIDWLQGQSWFDNIQHRMNSPEGVAIHFTRLAQLPIAAAIMLFHKIGYSWRGAGIVTSFLLPFAYMGIFLYVLRTTAERYVSKSWSRFSAFVAIFATSMLTKFAPSQVDHHGLELILIMTAIGLIAQAFASPSQKRYALAAGFVFALSTAIALEVLPWLVLASTLMGIWTIFTGPKAAKTAILYGLSLVSTGILCLFLKQPEEALFTPDLLSYSIAYVTLMAGIALCLFIAAAFTLLENASLRFFMTVPAAMAIGIAYVHRFPQLLSGPYGAMNPKLAAIFFSNVGEAIPGYRNFTTPKFYSAILLLIALYASIKRAAKGAIEKRWPWALIALFLLAALALTIGYQNRFIVYAMAFSLIPLTAIAESGWEKISQTKQGRGRFWSEIGLIALVGPLFTILLPAVHDGRAFNRGILMFPSRTNDDPCDISQVAKVLEAPPYADRNLRIINMIDQGSGLLFFTHHSVLSAPYHMNVNGNLTAIDFFSATDPAKAEQIARNTKADMVVACRYVPPLYFKEQNQKLLERNGSPADPNKQPELSLAVRLLKGDLPKWIKQVPLPQSPAQLYEITPQLEPISKKKL